MATRDDPIVEEFRGYREAFAAEFGHDLKRIVAEIQRQERESGRTFVDRRPRREPAEPRRRQDRG